MASLFPGSADSFKTIPNPTLTATNLSDALDDPLSKRLQDHSDSIVAVENFLIANALNEATGVIKMFAGTAAPVGYLLCDGSVVSRSTFSGLFAAIGTAYGVGDGSTTFGIPDMRGSVPMGAGIGIGKTARSLGDAPGTETVALTTAQLAAHTHTTPATTHNHTSTHSHTHTYFGSQGTVFGAAAGGNTVYINAPVQTSDANSTTVTVVSATIPAGTSGSNGSGTAHANIQPSLAVNFIIKF